MGIPTVAMATPGDFISVKTKDGAKSYSVQGISKITFATDGINIVTESGAATDTYLFSDIEESIVFEDIATGIASTQTTDGTLRISSRGRNTIVIDGHGDNAVTPVEIYSLAGTKVPGIAELRGSEINVSALPTGAYILKIGNKTIKFHK